MNIKTHFAYPPIPIRNYDWCATFYDYEPGDLIGYGHTEEAAIKDLEDQFAELTPKTQPTQNP